MQFSPDSPLALDPHTFAKRLRSAPSGSAPGPGGCSYQMLETCLDDAELLQLLTDAAEDFARAAVPQCVFHAVRQATMTAMMKPDGGIRGMVSKSSARQFMKDVEDVCSPFQLALSTRAGRDCVVHAVRALTDLNPDRTVMSIDGIGAHDHVFRSAMLAKVHDEPRRGAAPNVAGRRWGTGRRPDAPALQPCHPRFVAGREARHATRDALSWPGLSGGGPAAPDGSPQCNASTAAGRTGAQGGNPNGPRSFLRLPSLSRTVVSRVVSS